MNNYTLYPSPFVVMDGNGYYTKHYFAGSERIASRPAGLYTAGATPQPLVKPAEGSTKQLDETTQNQLLRLNQYLKEYKMPEAKFKKASKAEKEKQHLYNILEFEVNNLPSGENKQQALILLAKGDLETLKTLLKVEPTVTKKGKRGIDIYYFHPDHLGTATFISDANGEPYQFFLNLPFGETMAEQRAGSWQNPYKFNGKELDQETGLYYYGARYYNPRWSSWLSVDPMADIYLAYSPYNYTLNNPINYIDPNGMWVEGASFFRNLFNSDEKIKAQDFAKQVGSIATKNEHGNWQVNYRQKSEGCEECTGQVLDELVTVNFTKEKGIKNNAQSGGGSDWASNTANGLGAFGFANGGKNTLIDYAARAGNIGDDATKYIKISKGLSRGAGVLVLGVTLADAAQKGKLQNHHYADLAVGIATTFMLTGPWGWAIGGASFLTDLTIQHYTGRSISENLFDPTPTLNSNKR